MILSISDYVTDKLIKNCITFGFFMAGVLLGIALILIIYQIFVHLKAKDTSLCTEYKPINPENDPIILKAKSEIHSLDTKSSIENFLFNTSRIFVNAIRDIAKEYTGGRKYVTLNLSIEAKSVDFDLSFDTDFSLEDFLIFIENTTDVIENTVLSVTDKYSILVNSFLKFIGIGKQLREITVKDVILYLNANALKKEQKFIKAIEKKEKQEEKARQKENRKNQNKDNKFLNFFKPKENKKKTINGKQETIVVKNGKTNKQENKSKENRFLNLFKPKQKNKIADNDVETSDTNTKISAFYKPLNKVIVELSDILLVGLCVEARKLYGRGYTPKEVEQSVQNAEMLLIDPDTDEGGNE